MREFTKKADSYFYLESDGQPPLTAYMSTGGISSDDGSIRFTILNTSQPLTPGREYTLRPRNSSEEYKWVVGDGLRVAVPPHSGT